MGGGGGGGWGEGLFNLTKTIVSVLHKDLEYKVENLKYIKEKKLKDKKQIRTFSWWINHPWSVHMKFYSSDRLIQSIIY